MRDHAERERKKPEIQTKASNICICAFLISIFGVFPLFMQQGYIGLYHAKLVCYQTCVVVFLVILLVCHLYDTAGKGRTAPVPIKMTDWLFLLFLLIAAVSTACSSYPMAALTGLQGRRQGMMTLLCYGAAYFAITRGGRLAEPAIEPKPEIEPTSEAKLELKPETEFEIKPKSEIEPAPEPQMETKSEPKPDADRGVIQAIPLAVLVLVGCITSLIAVLQHFYIDPLGLFRLLSEKEIPKFISTIGNINFFSSYLCMVIPVTLYLFTRCADRKKHLLLLAALLLQYLGLICGNSDSAFLGLGVTFLVLLLYLARWTRPFLRLLTGIALFFAANLFLGLASDAVDSLSYSGLWKLLKSPALSGPCLAAVLAFFLFFAWKWRSLPAEQEHIPLRRGMGICVCTALLALAGILVYVNVVNSELELGDMENYLRFGKSWGDYRIREYRIAFDVLSRFTAKDVLLGCGPDTYGMMVKNAPVTYEVYTTSAHCEYLQYLITTGLLGLTAYLGLVISSLVCMFQKRGNEKVMAIALGCLSYLAQSSVNNIQIFTTPVFFTLLAFGIGLARWGGFCYNQAIEK